MEYRTAELRADTEGRQLTGLALPWETETRFGGSLERFTRGSAQPSGDAILNVQHDPARLLARQPGTLAFESRQNGLYVTADLPETREADDTLALVRSGVLTGLSVEFRATRERFTGGVRVIDAARIPGLAVVPRAAYPSTSIEARGAALAATVGELLAGPQLARAAESAGISEADLRRAIQGLLQMIPETGTRSRAAIPWWAL